MGSMENVAGRRIAMATAAPTPGMAPMITPPIDPISRGGEDIPPQQQLD